MYKGIQSEVLNTTRFDESSNLSITYLGRTDMAEQPKVRHKRSLLYQNKGVW